MNRKLATLLGAALGLAAIMPSAFAATSQSDTSTTVLSAGTLDVTSATAPDFAFTLNGAAATAPTDTLDFTVVDGRGSGGGWEVSVGATQFDNAGATRQLPVGSLDLAAPTVTACDGTNPASLTAANNVDSVAGTQIKMVDAGADEGMGACTLSSVGTLSIPATAYADTYTSTVTVTVAPGT